MNDSRNSMNDANWRDLMGMIQDQIKSSTMEWSNEKNQLIKKISDLEKEVSNLKKVNNDIAIKINLTPKETSTRSFSNTNTDKKFCNNNEHNKHIFDTDKMKREMAKLSKLKLQLLKQKINSEELKKNRYNSLLYNNQRKLNSFGGFEKLVENKLGTEIANMKSKKDPNYNITMFNNINLLHTNTPKQITISNTNNLRRNKQQNFKTLIHKEKFLNKAELDVTVVNKNTNESEIDSHPISDENRLSFVYKQNSHRQGESSNENNTRISLNVESLTPKASSTVKPNCIPITVLKSHFDAVRDIAISKDSKYLISVSEDMLIKFWDFKKALKTSKEIFDPIMTLRGHTKPIFALTTPNNDSSDSYNFYSGGSEGSIMYWKISSIKEDIYCTNEEFDKFNLYYPWKAHTDVIWQLSSHPTRNIICSVSSDGTAKLWNNIEESFIDKPYNYCESRSKNLIQQFSFKNHNYNLIEIPTSCAWSLSNRNNLYISYIAPVIKMYDIEAGKSVNDMTFIVEKNSPFECQQTNKIIYHGFFNLLVSAHEDRQIRFFDSKLNKCIKSIFAHSDSISTICEGTSQYQLLSGCHDGSFRCWDLRKFKLLYEIPAHRKKNDEGCLSILANSNKKQIVTCGSDSLIKIFESS